MGEWQPPAPVADYAAPVPADAPDAAAADRRRGRKAVMGVVGVLALLATGLAVTQLHDPDGAESPEAAVQAFFGAVDDEDPLGVLESLSPSERGLLVPSLRELADQLTRVEVTRDVDLEKVGGVDIEVGDLALRTDGLHPDVATVEITGGSVAVTARLADLPLGEALSGALADGGLDLDEPVRADQPLDLTLLTVRSGGGWHVSLLYTLAEAERARGDRPVPDFGHGIPARGAHSPEAAVEEMVAAFNDGDLARMIELTPPDSMAVLHDYGPGWVDDAGDRDDDERRVRLEDVVVGEPEGSGDTRRLPLEGYRYVTRSAGEEVRAYVYDGACVTASYPEWSVSADGEPLEPTAVLGTEKQCTGDQAEGSFIIGAILPPAGPLLFGPGGADIVVVERGGAWYVEPARSIVDTLLVNVEASSTEEMQDTLGAWARYLDQVQDGPSATAGAGPSGSCPAAGDPEPACVGDPGAATDEQRAAAGDCIASSKDREAVDACIALVFPDGSAEPIDPEDLCYENPDDAAVEACLRVLGDPDAVAELHRNRCYEHDDAGEVDACLQGLVDAGELGADVLAEHRCNVAYESLPDGISDEDYARAGEVFERCMVAAGSQPGVVGGDGGQPSTTVTTTG